MINDDIIKKAQKRAIVLVYMVVFFWIIYLKSLANQLQTSVCERHLTQTKSLYKHLRKIGKRIF